MTNELNLDLLDDDYAIVDIEDIGTQDIDPEDLSKAGEGDSPEEVAGKEEAKEGDPAKSGSESLPNLYSSLAKALGEEGFLPGLDKYEEIDNFDKLGEKIKEANKQALVDSLGFSLDNISELNQLQKDYLKALNEGVPAEVFIEAKRNEVSIEHLRSGYRRE